MDLHLSLSRAKEERSSRDVVVVGLELVVQIKVMASKRSGLGLSLWAHCGDLSPLFICKALLGLRCIFEIPRGVVKVGLELDVQQKARSSKRSMLRGSLGSGQEMGILVPD